MSGLPPSQPSTPPHLSSLGSEASGSGGHFIPTDDNAVVHTAIAGVVLRTTSNVLMFNASSLYKQYFKTDRVVSPELWRVALRSFLSTPAVRGVVSLIRGSGAEISLIERHDPPASSSGGHYRLGLADVWLHIGLLSMTLIDLKIATPDSLMSIHKEVRDLVSLTTADQCSPERRLIFPESELLDIVSDHAVQSLGLVVDHITNLAQSGSIGVGGVSALLEPSMEPRPWLGADCEDSPRTTRALSSLSPVINNPLLSDARMVLDIALHVIYVSLDNIMAKRAVVSAHCAELGIVNDALSARKMLMQARVVSTPRRAVIHYYSDSLLEEAVSAMLLDS